ncbi:sulfurtransferase [Williamsia sp. Leaf354]|uniref:Rhodanese-like domain-containing protein n=1 Tax=Williamsia herbipolensis TaxID=1603258 RepID=A0AAU4K7T5_9NOCA|nr:MULTISPECIES: rhodanese-like domain-containing protein [Williamsia]KQR98928.1 sulfurtransferase [Williamsia sp. Leaf354]MCX6468115.1 rhodanese-like domain-containing protein [Mycobacteriales bacterium]
MSVVDPISATEAAEHTQQGAAVVVDMRPQVVRHQGSLPGAVIVEPADLTAAFEPTSPRRMPCVCDLDVEIAVVSVRAQARRIAEQIAALGYTNVRYVDGDFPAFRSALLAG